MRQKTFLADFNESKDRTRLRARIQRLLDKWQPILGVTLGDWDIRKMKMYWGSSRRAGCDAFAYLVVHELVHHLTDGHDKKFFALMDKHVPGWRKMQAKIEEPLTRYS